MSDHSSAPLLRVSDLHVYYGAIHAIKGISLEVYENEIVTLIGANGAGKSTTLNTIAGLLKPRQGTVELNGRPLGGLGAPHVGRHDAQLVVVEVHVEVVLDEQGHGRHIGFAHAEIRQGSGCKTLTGSCRGCRQILRKSLIKNKSCADT